LAQDDLQIFLSTEAGIQFYTVIIASNNTIRLHIFNETEVSEVGSGFRNLFSFYIRRIDHTAR